MCQKFLSLASSEVSHAVDTCLSHALESYMCVLAIYLHVGGSEEKALQSDKEAKPLKQEV